MHESEFRRDRVYFVLRTGTLDNFDAPNIVSIANSFLSVTSDLIVSFCQGSFLSVRMEIAIRLNMLESNEITVFHENHGIVLIRLLVPSFDDPVIIIILM